MNTAAHLLSAELSRLADLSLTESELLKARLIYADTLGCILAGLTDAEVSALARRFPQTGMQEPITGVQHSPGDMAMLLGFAAAAYELDEGHYEAGGHPAAPVVAAILTEAAATRPTGERIQRAFVVGYEAAARVGRAVRLRPDTHPHGTWGVVGAAMAVAVLRDLPQTDWPELIDMASSLATATSFDTPLRGGSVRSAWIGLSARNALMACDLHAAGVTAGSHALERILGGVLGQAGDGGSFHQSGATRFLLMTNFMKLEASCRETQGALAALDKAIEQVKLPAENVRNIKVETFKDPCRLDDPLPSNATAARFSIPATLAARVMLGDITPESFTLSLLADATFQRLARNVEMVPSAVPMPGARPCTVSVTMADGSSFSASMDTCPGDPTSPLTAHELHGKFLKLANYSDRIDGQTLWDDVMKDWAASRAVVRD